MSVLVQPQGGQRRSPLSSQGGADGPGSPAGHVGSPSRCIPFVPTSPVRACHVVPSVRGKGRSLSPCCGCSSGRVPCGSAGGVWGSGWGCREPKVGAGILCCPRSEWPQENLPRGLPALQKQLPSLSSSCVHRSPSSSSSGACFSRRFLGFGFGFCSASQLHREPAAGRGQRGLSDVGRGGGQVLSPQDLRGSLGCRWALAER